MSFQVSISREQLGRIRAGYEQLRKTEQCRGRRIRKIFDTKPALDALKTEARACMSNEDLLTLQLKIRFASNEESRARWLEYGNVLLRLFQAFAPRGAEPIIALYPIAEESNLGYKIGCELSVARSVR